MRRHSYAILLLCAASGCTTMSSTLLNRTDSDQFFGNSNGEPNASEGAVPYKGVPITLRVPTHLDISIKETIWIGTNKGSNRLYQVSTAKRHLFAETKLIETDKVFTVDIKRPAAGIATYTLGFGNNVNGIDNSQYFATIAAKLEDKTINEVNTALTTILPLLSKSSTSAKQASASEELNLIEENRLVAWKRFDLDSPDFELQVECFVEQHLNACNNFQSFETNPVP